MYYLTQSLLSNWIHFLNAEDGYADSALESFTSALRREPLEPTPAMLAGREFEAAVNARVAGEEVEFPNEKFEFAARYFAKLCTGGQAQVPVGRTEQIAGLTFRLYGICDYVKAGTIYDIKRVQRYEYGKYFKSPQHPMYLHLIPGAGRFTYLIFDGANTYTETYRRGDFVPIEDTISRFIRWLKEYDYWDVYKENWTMKEGRN